MFRRVERLLKLSLAGALMLLATPAWTWAQAKPAISVEEARGYRQQGDRDFESQLWGQALIEYLRAYPRFEHDFDLNYRIGSIYLNSAKPDLPQALNYLRKAHQLKPDNAAALHDYARAAAYSRRFDEAVPLYRQLVNAVPLVAKYRLEYARTLVWAGQNQEAATVYTAYLDRAPSDFPARIELANLLGQQKDFPGAMQQYNYVLRFQPGNLAARVGHAQVQAWTGQVKTSLDEVEAVLRDSPDSFDARLVKAYDLLWLGKPEEARPLFQALARLKPDNPEVREGLKEATAAVAAPRPAPGAPAAPLTPLQVAERYEAQGNFPAAIKTYRDYLGAHPDDANAQFLLARDLGWNKDFAESESRLRDWTSAHADHPEGTLQLARVLSWEQSYKDSAEEYRHYLVARPRDAAAHAELSGVLLALGDYSHALDEGRAALSLDPSDAEAEKATIRALIALRDTAQAQAELTKLQQAHPDDPELAALRSRVETEGSATPVEVAATPQPVEAEAYFRNAVAQNPNDVDARLQLADVYAARKQFTPAIEQLQAASRLRPDDEATQLKIARVLSWDRQYTASEAAYEQLLSRRPENVSARVELARVLSWAGNYPASETQYQQALQRSPQNTQLRLEYARVLSWDKKYDASLEQFDQVLKADPKNYDALLGKARAYSYQSHWKESQQAYDAALAVRPNDREALIGKAQNTLWAGDAGAARSSLLRLHDQDPKNPTLLVSLASAENSLGRPDQALRLLDDAQKIDPNNRDARTMRDEIRDTMRPELRLGWTYLRDTEGLNQWRYQALDFRFNLHPRLRNYVTLEYMPTSAPAPIFGYAVGTTSGFMFAPRVPINPNVPSPTLLTSGDFPAGALVPASSRIHQGAAQLMFGGTMQVNGRFSWTAGIGAVQIRHGSSNFGEPDLFPTTETRAVYTVSPSIRLTRKVTLTLGASRQYWTYTPKSTAQDIHVDQQDGSLTWNVDSRSQVVLGYWHRAVLPEFEIPTISLVGPPAYNFTGRTFQLHGHGVTATATRTVVKLEKSELAIGYDAMAFGYSHPSGLISPEFFVNAGVFTPSFYQRHAGLVRVTTKPWDWLTWDLHGSAGGQQIHQGSDFSFSSTAGTRLDIKTTSHSTLSLGYDYFNTASALQVAIITGRAAAYHSNDAYILLDIKF